MTKYSLDTYLPQKSAQHLFGFPRDPARRFNRQTKLGWFTYSPVRLKGAEVNARKVDPPLFYPPDETIVEINAAASLGERPAGAGCGPPDVPSQQVIAASLSSLPWSLSRPRDPLIVEQARIGDDNCLRPPAHIRVVLPPEFWEAF